MSLAFLVQSKPEGQSWNLEACFDVDSHLTEGEALSMAQAVFDALVSGHAGPQMEYRLVRCVELAREVRPVP